MELNDIQAYTKRLENEYLELLTYRKGILRQIDLEEQQLKGDEKIRRIVQLENRIKELESKPKEIVEPDIIHQDLIAYKERLKREYEEILSWREGIIKQSKEDEEKLKELQKEKETVIKEISAEITEANSRLETIKKERQEYLNGFTDREQEISASLIHIEEQRKIFDKERDDFSRSTENYELAIKGIEDERVKLEAEKIQIGMEKQIWDKMVVEEKQRNEELKRTKELLEKKNIKQKRALKVLKIKELKLNQKSEAVKKTGEFFKTEFG